MATHLEKITNIEKSFQSALILEPTQRSSKKISKRVYININFDVDFKRTWKKHIYEVKLLAL